MNTRRLMLAVALGIGLSGAGATVYAQHHHQVAANQEPQQAAMGADSRVLVQFPEHMRIHTLANMRDHLLAISEIQEALSKGLLDKAADIAEQRLGMTSLIAHGAHDLSPFMPQGMQDIGTSMHHNASQFAVEVQNSAVTGDMKPALAALSRTTQACVACHASYRLQ